MEDVQTETAAPSRSGAGRARWYIVHAYSNFEGKVAEAIRDQAQRQGLEGQFEDIQVPTEEVTEVVRGAKKVRQHRHFPGYVLVKMEMTDEAYHLVKNTPKVTGFLTGGGKALGHKPVPVSETEVSRVVAQVKEGVERPKPSVMFEVGEQVRVTDGPFQTFMGVVEEVDHDRARLKVAVSIFGRATPVELEYTQVEKA